MDKFDIRKHYSRLEEQLLARDSIVGTLFSHGTIQGNESEEIIRNFLRIIMPPYLGVETGQIVATNGTISPQADVILFEQNPGSIIGLSENGISLIRLEAVLGVVEVKRSINRGTIQEIQKYGKALRESFIQGERPLGWIQWAFAFRSFKTKNEIIKELNKYFDPENSVGLLLVLDCARSAKELLEIEHDHSVFVNKVKMKITGKGLLNFLSVASKSNSALFGRNNTSYSEIRSKEPPLFNFVKKLEERYFQKIGFHITDKRMLSDFK